MDSLDPIIFKEKLENLEIWSDILVIISIIILIIGIILKRKKNMGKSLNIFLLYLKNINVNRVDYIENMINRK